MSAITRPLAQVFVRMKNDPEMRPFVDWVLREYEEARLLTEGLEGVPLHRAQGRAKTFGELKSNIEGAENLFAKVRDK